MLRAERQGPLQLLAGFLPILLWVAVGLPVTLLALRFGLRLAGVRGDIALPGAMYALTAPFVEPFYRFFPAAERFDYPAVEVAALAAAGIVLALGLMLYVVGLLVAHVFSRLGRG